MEAENINNPQSPALQQGAVMRSCVLCNETFSSKEKAFFCPQCEDEEFEDLENKSNIRHISMNQSPPREKKCCGT